MAELSVQERLLPSLLDRLRDDRPGDAAEFRDQRVMSVRQIRECVVRDLNWLLNAANLGERLDADSFPRVARSVLNYGMPPLSGHTVTGADVGELESLMHDAIRHFEPRILPNTLHVALVLRGEQHSNRALTFDIEGEMWAQPVPVRLYLRTELDLEVGAVRVTESVGGR